MKKSTFLLSLLLSSVSTAVMAEGYQVNVLSSKQTGMGHTGVAMKLGAESMHFNPAGMAFMEGTADFSAGMSAIFATAKWENDGVHAKTNNDTGTPIYAYAGFRVYDNFKVGLAFTTPYGSSITWPKNWPGATMVQHIEMRSFVFQPTLAWKILDNLSIGGGVMLAYGDVNLSKGLMDGDAFNGAFHGVVPVSVKLHGDAHVRVGFNVGVMYDINDKVTVGASYRSRIRMKVKEGDAKLEYSSDRMKEIIEGLASAVPGLSALPLLDQGTFHAELPLPENYTFGVSYKPTDPLTLALDVQITGWKAYDMLEIGFNEEVLHGFNQSLVKNYKTSFAVRVGGEYAVTERFDARAGIYFDQSPVRKDFYNPETPGMNKLGVSIGCSFRPFDQFSINFAALYIAGLSRDGNYTNHNILGQPEVFSGHYKSSAFCPSLGLSYDF